MGSGSEHPFFFGEGSSLFGVFHRPAGGRASSGGWVFCSAFGVERNNSHRLLVEFARELCRAGVPVLRFDYRGTGDSAGHFDEVTVLDHLADITLALGELGRWTGRPAVGLLGLRLGASLAAKAAAEQGGGLPQLVLWEPVPSGAVYREQLLRLTIANELVNHRGQRRSRDDLRRELAAGGTVVADGFPLSGAMFNSLGAIDLVALERAPARRVLLVQLDQQSGLPLRREMESLRGRLAGRGALRAVQASAPPAWLRTKQYFWRPPELFGKTLAWIRETAEPSGGEFSLPDDVPGALDVTRTNGGSAVIERPVSFSVAGEQVFGLLHRPTVENAPGRSGARILMLPAGETPRSSVFYPRLARELASAGHTVLRFDPRGLGDSAGDTGPSSVAEVFRKIEHGMFVPDTAAALDFLSGETGLSRFVLTGLCGGAITSIYSAAADRRVAAIAPLELRMHLDRVSDPGDGESSGRANQLPWLERLATRRGAAVWLAARNAVHLLRRGGKRARLEALRWLSGRADDAPGEPAWFLARLGADANLEMLSAFGRVIEREIPVLCVFADRDGRRYFEAALPGLLAGRPVISGLGIEAIEGADHNFVMPGCPERLSRLLLAWLGSARGLRAKD